VSAVSSSARVILDLGCGTGRELASWGVSEKDAVIGLDLDGARLVASRQNFPGRTFVQGRGELLPFPESTFHRVISRVAVPYMSIQAVVPEIFRVLRPGGEISLSLHPPLFTLHEIVRNALPRLRATIFRLYVATNGVYLHCTGRTFAFRQGRVESFQTVRGIRLALRRAGFVNLSFRLSEPTDSGKPRLLLAHGEKPGRGAAKDLRSKSSDAITAEWRA